MIPEEKYLKLCFELAEKGRGFTSPNPVVGCVIVKNGRIIGRGYHKGYGMPHAEIEAINSVENKNLLKNSTLYVNLEPCVHYGKTPPCVDSIIKYGIKNLICCIVDPNPLVKGKGIYKLKKNSINCKVNILQKEAIEINKFYLKWITKKLPYILIKAATTLDGKITTAKGDSKWISSKASREYVHELREKYDAVMVGMNTIIKDNPSLTSHGGIRNPIRITIGDISKIPKNSNIFNKEANTILLNTSNIEHSLKNFPNNIHVYDFHKKNTKEMFTFLAEKGITSILVEGGGETIWEIIKNKLADEFMIFIAPKIFGGRDAKTFVEGEGVSSPKNFYKIKFKNIDYIDEDILIKGMFQFK